MTNKKTEVLFFDVNETLLDLKEVRDSVGNALRGNEEVVSLWFETMLHYSLVSTTSDEYHNFGEIGAAALMMVVQNRNVDLDREAARKALEPIRTAPPKPAFIETDLERLASKL